MKGTIKMQWSRVFSSRKWKCWIQILQNCTLQHWWMGIKQWANQWKSEYLHFTTICLWRLWKLTNKACACLVTGMNSSPLTLCFRTISLARMDSWCLTETLVGVTDSSFMRGYSNVCCSEFTTLMFWNSKDANVLFKSIWARNDTSAVRGNGDDEHRQTDAINWD